MPSYKLIYFPLRAKAEAIRMIFAAAGVDFEDVRYTMDDWISKYKNSGISPSRQLPVLYVDGKVLMESKVILSYVGKELNLAPKDNFQLAQADVLAHIINDLENVLSAANRHEDSTVKEEALETARKEVIPDKCGYFEKFLAANDKEGFFLEDKLTYADIVVFTFLNSYYLKGSAEGVPEELKAFPKLHAWYELVRTQPKIQQWLKTPRPDLGEYPY